MNITFVATLGGLAALFGWGVSDWLSARSSKLFSTFETNTAIQLPGLIIGPVLLFFTNQKLPNLNEVILLVITTIFFTFAFLFFIKALSKGAVGIVAPIANSFPLITLILSVIFLSSIFTHIQILSMIIIVLGTILLAHEKNENKLSRLVLYKESLLALGAAISWGIGFFIVNTIITKVSWQVVVGVLSISQGVIALILLLSSKDKIINKIKSLPQNHSGLISGIILIISTIAFYAAGQRARSILIATVIGSAAPLITSLLAAYVDKEKLNIIKRVGAVIVVSGIVLLNLN